MKAEAVKNVLIGPHLQPGLTCCLSCPADSYGHDVFQATSSIMVLVAYAVYCRL